MKSRKMLLCVTATSVAAAVGCTPPDLPVGNVGLGRPDNVEMEASSPDDMDAAAPDAVSHAPDKQK